MTHGRGQPRSEAAAAAGTTQLQQPTRAVQLMRASWRRGDLRFVGDGGPGDGAGDDGGGGGDELPRWSLG